MGPPPNHPTPRASFSLPHDACASSRTVCLQLDTLGTGSRDTKGWTLETGEEIRKRNADGSLFILTDDNMGMEWREDEVD